MDGMMRKSDMSACAPALQAITRVSVKMYSDLQLAGSKRSGYHHGSASIMASDPNAPPSLPVPDYRPVERVWPGVGRPPPAVSPRPRLPAGRAVLAVRRALGAADGRGARGAQPRAERSAVRDAEASVLRHDRVSEIRGGGLRARGGDGARLGGVPRARRRRSRASSRTVLSAGRGAPAGPLRHRRTLRRHRRVDRRSARAVRARALAAAGLVPDPMTA